MSQEYDKEFIERCETRVIENQTEKADSWKLVSTEGLRYGLKRNYDKWEDWHGFDLGKEMQRLENIANYSAMLWTRLKAIIVELEKNEPLRKEYEHFRVDIDAIPTLAKNLGIELINKELK